MGNLKVRTRVWRLTPSCEQSILRESILNENALLITSRQPLSLTRLCHVNLMPGRRAPTAVLHRVGDIGTHIPGAGEPRPSSSFSRRPVGHTRPLTGVLPAQGRGCSSLLGKGVRCRRRKKGQGGALSTPAPEGPSPTHHPLSPAAQAGGGAGGEPEKEVSGAGGLGPAPHGRAGRAGPRSPAGGDRRAASPKEGSPAPWGGGHPTGRTTLPGLSVRVSETAPQPTACWDL